MNNQSKITLFTLLTLLSLLALFSLALGKLYRREIYTPIDPGAKEKIEFVIQVGESGAKSPSALKAWT